MRVFAGFWRGFGEGFRGVLGAGECICECASRHIKIVIYIMNR